MTTAELPSPVTPEEARADLDWFVEVTGDSQWERYKLETIRKLLTAAAGA